MKRQYHTGQPVYVRTTRHSQWQRGAVIGHTGDNLYIVAVYTTADVGGYRVTVGTYNLRSLEEHAMVILAT